MTTLDDLLAELRHLDVKLWVEDDRLRYRAAKDILTPVLLEELKAHKSEIVKFLQQISSSSLTLSPISPAPREGNLPLSFAQERLWILNQLEPDSPAYNIPIPLQFKGVVNLPALEQSFNEIVRRHETLRTTFHLVDGQPTQLIVPDLKISVEVVNLQDLPLDQRETTARHYANQEAQCPFNLVQDPLIRVKLFSISETDHVLMWNIHCIVCDGSSVDIFFQEFISLYRAYAIGQISPLSDLPIQYADFVHWQRHCLQGSVLDAQLSYWKQQLGGHLSMLRLPIDHLKPITKASKGDRCFRVLPKALNQKLNTLSQQSGTTLFMTLLAAFKVLLHRYSGNDDILISFANAGRNRVEIEKLIGFFGNTLILRTDLSGNPKFRGLLSRVRDVALGAYANQDLPFERLVEEIRPERSFGQSPLFQVTFALNPPWTDGRGMAAQDLPEATIQSLFGYVHSGALKFDLALVMRETDQGLRALFEYNTDLFKPETIARLLDCFQTLLESVVEHPDCTISDLPLLNQAEQKRLLTEWNPVSMSVPYDLCIHQVFEAQVDQTPDAVALDYQGVQLTYRELNIQANKLARHLQRLGVKVGMPVGAHMIPSSEGIITLLAILKAGGAFVPLPLIDNSEQLELIFSTTQVTIVLTQIALVNTLNACSVKSISVEINLAQGESSENLDYHLASESIAFIRCVNTMSSHNQAFGIPHRSALSQLKDTEVITLSPQDIVLHHSPLASQAAAFEIWSCLLNGAKLAIAPQCLTPETLGQVVQQHQITTVWLPTRWLQRIVNKPLSMFKSVQQLLMGGDMLTGFHIRSLFDELPDCKLTYTYSTLGNVGFTCTYPITELPSIDTPIPIGRPVTNTQAYILDRNHQLAPIGIPGELYISAKGLIYNCFNSSDGLAGSFISHLFSADPNTYLYKTRNRVRYLADGNIELIGKISYYTTIQEDCYFELNRIEAIIAQHPDVQECAVVAYEDLPIEKCIVAYVVWYSGATASIANLRMHLKRKLPTSMIPSAFVPINTIPLMGNGDIDYLKLPYPALEKLESSQFFTVSCDEVERELIQIWQSIFEVESIGVDDNFFELGGHSLLAVRLFTQIEENFNKRLPLSILLQSPTIQELAKALREHNKSSWSPLVQIKVGSPDIPPLFCIHGGGFNVLVYRDLALNLHANQPVYALQAQGLEGRGGVWANRLEDIATDYIREIRTVQPFGPYHLSGLSNGGNIALEMAQQLQNHGEVVAFLAMFDSYGSEGIKLLPPLPRFISSLKYVLQHKIPKLVFESLTDPSRFFDTFPKNIYAFTSAINGLVKSTIEVLLSTERVGDSSCTEPSSTSTSKKDESEETVFEKFMNRFSRYILEHSAWAFFSPSAQLRDLNDNISTTLKQLEKHYSNLHGAYQLKSYSGKIFLFRATESPPGYWIDPQLGWGSIAKDGVLIYKIPGNHTSLMKSPKLGQTIDECLETLRCSSGSFKSSS